MELRMTIGVVTTETMEAIQLPVFVIHLVLCSGERTYLLCVHPVTLHNVSVPCIQMDLLQGSIMAPR